MGEAKTESKKPVLQLAGTSAFGVGGYWCGDHVGGLCVSYMNLTGGTALATHLACIIVGGGIGLIVGLLLDKKYNVRQIRRFN
ncbi:MAG: hypothetical protein IJU26_00360 [Synergistaceae bacterium]|nr:hypothetical protein [Synergistaceae bacterium]